MEIEARAQARYAVQLAEHEAKLAAREAKQERGEKVSGESDVGMDAGVRGLQPETTAPHERGTTTGEQGLKAGASRRVSAERRVEVGQS